MKKSLLNSLVMAFGCLVLFSSCNSVPKDGVYKFPTEKPVVLPAGTDGSVGPEGTYVLFGDWPQTVKADDVNVSEEMEVLNGWECYKGSDDCYYVRQVAKPWHWRSDDYKFDNGEVIEEGEEYYFKVEPIKWRVVTKNYQKGKLLVAENVLVNSSYDTHFDIKNDQEDERTVNGKTIYVNNYEFSTIRAYLNGLDGSNYDVENFTGKGFINKAFTKEAIKNINTVTIDNSKESTECSFNSCACKNTEDKIFLLSVEEVTKSSYGFNSNTQEKDGARRRKTTDYSRAIGSSPYTGEEYKNNDWWWLRSPHFSGNFVHGVEADGLAFRYDIIDRDSGGVVPALSIKF